MKSLKAGKNTSNAKVLHISRFGLWILIEGTEYFLPYRDFPWFKTATVEQIYNLYFYHKKHLRWPDLDIDLEVESLTHLEQYPLVYK